MKMPWAVRNVGKPVIRLGICVDVNPFRITPRCTRNSASGKAALMTACTSSRLVTFVRPMVSCASQFSRR
jgi:hypothetical protein